jgi:hypothetical protein
VNRQRRQFQDRLCRLLAATFLLLVATPLHAETVDFQVLRNGSQIGTHIMSFARNGDDINVSVAIDIDFKFAFITLYRFVHEGHELWRQGRLVSMDTVTNDDGTKHRVSVRADGETYQIAVDGRNFVTPRIALGSLWRADYPADGTMLDTVDGSLLKVRSRHIGEEKIATADGEVSAQHYEIRGDLVRDIWFDAKGSLLRLLFPADDGSQIEYRRF